MRTTKGAAAACGRCAGACLWCAGVLVSLSTAAALPPVLLAEGMSWLAGTFHAAAKLLTDKIEED